MELKELKKGDRIVLLFGFRNKEAKIISNNPTDRVIYLNVEGRKTIKHYSDYNFNKWLKL